MSWLPAGNIARHQHNRRGLAPAIDGGLVCHFIEQNWPNQCRPVSVKNGILKIEVTHAQYVAFRSIQGLVLERCQQFCVAQNLPKITRIRLTLAS